MCGRTACTLQKESLVKACMYTSADGKKFTPTWKDVHSNVDYNPCYNIAPGSFSPVLIKSSHLEEVPDDLRVLCPMKWGLIPSWYQGEKKSFQFKTNNCQAENIENKRSYRGSLLKGRRCVIVADGFYEWKKLPNGNKQPYFIYSSIQSNGFNMKERNWSNDEEFKWVGDEWSGPNLLTMAGLFDIWKSKSGELLYSYTVITVEASSSFSSIHNRMPAILNGADIQNWLDYDNISAKEAIKLLRPMESLEWYAVSTKVNYSYNNNLDCLLPVKTEKTIPKKNTFLTSWLKKSNDSKNNKDEEPSSKQIKLK